MRIVFRAIFLIAAAVLVLFAVSNRETVSVALWPLPFVADLPLYLLCILGVAIGGLLGVGAAWAAGRRRRRELRALRRRIAALERELAATQSRLDEHRPGAPELQPPARLRPLVTEYNHGTGPRR